MARNKLIEHNHSVEIVIKEYMGIPIKSNNKTSNASTNQMIYKEFRNFLDDASKKHREKEQAS